MSSDWNNLEVVSQDLTSRAITPVTFLDNQGNLHVVWADNSEILASGTDYDIFYRCLSSGEWSPTELISAESDGDSNSPDIFVDSLNNIHVTWEDVSDYSSSGTDLDIFYKHKDQNTGTWTPSEVVSAESTLDSSHPSIAVDGSNIVHIAWQDESNYAGINDNDPDVFYKNKDTTWSDTMVISSDIIAYDVGMPSLDVDSSDTIHLVYVDYIPGSMFSMEMWPVAYRYKLASSNDWSSKTNFLGNDGVDTASTTNPEIKVDSLGNLHVVFGEVGAVYPYTGTGVFYKQKSAQYGWMSSDMLSVNGIEQELSYIGPSLDIDAGNNIHAAWTQNDVVYYDFLAAGTYTWVGAQVISTGTPGPSHDPSISASAENEVHIAWSNDTHTDGTDFPDIYYTNTLVPLTPTADFSADKVAIHPGEQVQFTYTGDAGYEPTTYEWDFGDGSSNSTEIDPLHQYTVEGQYTVILTITDSQGQQDTMVKSNYITVEANQAPVAAFSFAPLNPVINEEVQFSDESTDIDGTITSWQWNFGDGEPNSTIQNPTHTFSSEGPYTIILTVFDDDGDSSSASSLIEITEPQTTTMHVFSIEMWYEEVLFRGRLRNYDVFTRVTVKDGYGNLLLGVSVTIDLETPKSEHYTLNGITGADGSVTLVRRMGKNDDGQYISTVTNLEKSEYVYDPNLNLETSDSIIVP